MKIKAAAERLCRKYSTRDPYEIANRQNIIVKSEHLGSIRGYYNKCYRQKFIHVNCDIPEEQQRKTCAHELGHAVMHPDANTPFLRDFTLFSVNRLEKEANQFMIQLLFPDDQFQAYCYYTIPQVAQMLQFSEDLVKYKFSTLRGSDANERSLLP